MKLVFSSSNLDGEGDQGGKQEVKEERKPRRSSVFSKLGSYRPKKVLSTLCIKNRFKKCGSSQIKHRNFVDINEEASC